MILFSIPVHEKPEVVENQIQNFLKYNPGASILLHISKQMPPDEVAQIKQLTRTYPQLYINPEQLYTGWANGCQFKIHLSNLHYALKININFQFVGLHASNDMFINYGLLDYIKNYQAGFDLLSPPEHNPVRHQKTNLKKHFFYQLLMKKYQLKEIIPSQVEGTFYNRETVELLCARLNKYNTYDFPWLYSVGYYSPNHWRTKLFTFIEKVIRNLKITIIHPNSSEEVIPSTFVFDKVQKIIPFPYCYINWNNNLSISTEEITALRQQNNQWLQENNTQFALFPQDKLHNLKFFAVKRINRDISDPLRIYITQELD